MLTVVIVVSFLEFWGYCETIQFSTNGSERFFQKLEKRPHPLRFRSSGAIPLKIQKQTYTPDMPSKGVRPSGNPVILPSVEVNRRRAHELFWRGSPNAPLIQRIAVCMLGFTLFGIGLAFLRDAHEYRSFIQAIFGLGVLLIGATWIRNGFRRAPKNDRCSN